jgi:SAM-dependent methyltransferase
VEETRNESLDLLIELAGPRADDVVLDYAAFPSMVTFAVAPQVCSLDAAADKSGMLEEGRRLALELGLANVTFTLVDRFALPYADDAFSLAMGCEALHLYPDPAAALAELRRVTRTNGRVVLVEPVVDDVIDEPFNDLAGLRQPGHRRHLRLAELERLVAQAGLRVSRRGSARCTVDLEYWLQTAGVPPSRATLIRERFLGLPVDVQMRLDVAFSDRSVCFSYDVVGLCLERA